LITDGARLVPGGSFVERHEALVSQAHAAAVAGIDFVQVRERDLSARDLLALTIEMIAAAGERTRVLVNDRLDVALAADAAGVHLRGQSVAAADARAIAPARFMISRAVHSIEEVRETTARAEADFVVFGTVFHSASKPAGHMTAGVSLLDEASRCGVPVLAIGGVDESTVRQVAATAATGVAAIGWFLTSDAERLSAAAALIRRTFDTTGPVI
jgi:thiamine-phosphate diphosphorylase